MEEINDVEIIRENLQVFRNELFSDRELLKLKIRKMDDTLKSTDIILKMVNQPTEE